jgi:predicted glycosyltransferase
VLVSAGGGAVGARLIETAVAARDLLPPTLSWRILTGPNLPEDRFRALATRAAEAGPGAGGLVVERFHPDDLARLMAGARLSLSQAGYNTVCDLLRAGCAGILVPFASGGETEQTLRANLLARRGLARVLPEEGLAPARLARTVAEALEAGPPPAALA